MFSSITTSRPLSAPNEEGERQARESCAGGERFCRPPILYLKLPNLIKLYLVLIWSPLFVAHEVENHSEKANAPFHLHEVNFDTSLVLRRRRKSRWYGEGTQSTLLYIRRSFSERTE